MLFWQSLKIFQKHSQMHFLSCVLYSASLPLPLCFPLISSELISAIHVQLCWLEDAFFLIHLFFYIHTETHPYKVHTSTFLLVSSWKKVKQVVTLAFVLVLNNSTRTNAGLLIQEYDGSSLFSHCVFSAVKHLRNTIGKSELSLPSAVTFNHERF